MFYRLRLLFAKGAQGVCGGVEEIGSGVWPASRCARRTASARLIVAMQPLDQENPPYTSAVLEFVGRGFVSVLRMRDLEKA